LWSDHDVLAVSPILKRVVYPCLANSGYLRRRAEGGSFCVITYHGILPDGYRVSDPQQDGSLVTADNFRSQLRLLKKCYRVVTPDQVRDWLVDGKALPELAVLLTCDDGLRNTLTGMAPILQAEELSCLFFVLGASAAERHSQLWYEELYTMLLAPPSGRYAIEPVGTFDLGDRTQRRSLWGRLLKTLSQHDQPTRTGFLKAARVEFGLPEQWDARVSNEEASQQRFSILNAADLRELVQQGMGIGAHTLNHPILSQQSSDQAWKEISESRSLLEAAVGTQIWALAYPFGDPASVTAREFRMAEQSGFQCAFMNVGGGFGAQLPRFALPRVHVTADMTLSEFEAHVSGFHRAFRSRLSRDTA
jgi:peptidoglycan/xylan/chitin deacetylase (PgdA/CDA1 family)